MTYKSLDIDSSSAVSRAVKLVRLRRPLVFDEGVVGDCQREALEEGLSAWRETRAGHLYIAMNASWPGTYKVGCTQRSVEARMRQLSGSGVATPWVAVASWSVYDAHGLEAMAHKACQSWQVKGELFQVPFEVLRATVDAVVQEDARLLAAELGVFGGVFEVQVTPC